MANEKERFEILLEDMYDKIKIVAEGHGILVNKIDSVKAEVTEVKAEITKVEIRLNNKIDSVKSELNNKIDSVKSELNEKIDSVKSELKQDINEVKKGVNRIDGKLTHVMERQDMQEEKLEKVYKKVFVGN